LRIPSTIRFRRSRSFGVIDLAGNTGRVFVRHKDQIPTRQGDTGGDTGTLGAARSLDHLNEHFLPALYQVPDRGLLAGTASAPVKAALGAAVRSGFGGILVVFAAPARDNISGIQEGVPLQPDLDKGGIERMGDIIHPALVDASDDTLFALDVQLCQLPVFADRDARFARVRVDNNLFRHVICCSCRPRAGALLLPGGAATSVNVGGDLE
jgi:hypothetical protein